MVSEATNALLSSQGVLCKHNLVHRKDAWTRWQLRDVDLRAQPLGLLANVPDRTWELAIATVCESRPRASTPPAGAGMPLWLL